MLAQKSLLTDTSIFVYAIFIALSGCATTRDCDPRRDPGLFGSINCHSSGAYSQRIEDKQLELSNAKSESTAIRQKLSGTQATSQQLAIDIQQAESQLNDMDNQLRTLQSSLKHTKGANSSLNSEISKLQKKISNLKSGVRKGKANKSEIAITQANINKVKQQVQSQESAQHKKAVNDAIYQ